MIDHQRIDALNEFDESVTVATLPPFARVEPRQQERKEQPDYDEKPRQNDRHQGKHIHAAILHG